MARPHDDTLFEYHAPTEAQIEDMKVLRAKFKELHELILAHTPSNREQSVAIMDLRKVSMMVNASVIFGPEARG